MKKILLSILAVLSAGSAAAARADDSTNPTPAARNAALFASGTAVHVNGVYYYNGRRFYHRRLVGYETRKITTISGGVRYVRYKQVPVYTYW